MDRTELEQWSGREVARLLALLEAERRYYQEILSALPVGAAVMAQHGGFVTANRAFRRILNVRSEQLHGKSLAQILPSARLETCVHESFDSGATHLRIPVELAGRALAASVMPVRGWDGEMESLVLITVDEVASGPTPAADLPALRDLPALVWTLDPDTLQYRSVQGAGDHLLGYSQRHWLNTPGFWLDRVYPEDRPAVEEFYRTALAQGGEFSCEFRAVAYQRKIVWRRDTFRVTRDDDGHVISISGLTTDVAARRQSELDNVQANRADALAGLSRRLAHDLNNALMIVTGYGEELLAGLPEDDSRYSDVQTILAAAESMAGIAGELHGFTRKQASPAVPADVSELLNAAAARIRTELGATLVLRPPEKGLFAQADAVQLEAALISIARRLRDKTDPHMILAASEVLVTEMSGFEHALKPGRYVEISVRGPYVCAVPTQAFEAFLSGKDPHSSDLARTYAIVREWGGSMFTSRTENASEVRVLLPAAHGEAQGPAAEQPPPVTESAATVLVVEDEKGIRSLVKKILTREGYTVLEAANADEAIELARHRGGVDVLLADMMLPGKSGRELAEALRATDPGLRVVYISGYTGDIEVPASDTLQKPFTLTALVKKVREALL